MLGYAAISETAISALPATASAESPEITSDLTARGVVGAEFEYEATATGDEPITWSAGGLPGGLAIDEDTGVIDGTPTAGGEFDVTLTATNAGGSDVETLVITVAQVTDTFETQTRSEVYLTDTRSLEFTGRARSTTFLTS